MKVKSQKEVAQELVLQNVADSLQFSLEFYAREIGIQVAKGGDPYIIEHCEQMYRAYKQIQDAFNHFKFN